VVRYHRIDGVRGTVPQSCWYVIPWGLLDIPGADGSLLLSSGDRYHSHCYWARDSRTGEVHWRVWMVDPDRHVMDKPDRMASGTVRMPHQAFWHFLTPRDLPGSQALRRISESTVRELLKAAATSGRALRDAIVALLPEVSHPLLVDGIAGVVQAANRQITDLERLLTVLRRQAVRSLKVSETDLDGALSGLVSEYHEGHGGMVRQIELAAAFLAGSINGETAVAHWGIHRSQYDWTELIGSIGGLAVRAASAVTPAHHRTALAALLRFWASSPLTDPELQRGLHDHEKPVAIDTRDGKLLPLDIAMHYGDWARSHDDSNYTVKGFLQRGSVPRPKGFIDVRPVAGGWATPERLRALADALDRREPVEFDPGAAGRLAGASSLGRAAAALLLTGLPVTDGAGGSRDTPVSARTRKALGLRPTEARDAVDRLRRLPAPVLLGLFDAALPSDPTVLWDQHAMAERLAEAWLKSRQKP
jgi:hypothetical protein